MDLNIVNTIATSVGSIVTAVGVVFAAWQIRLSKKQTQAEFEDSLDQQYRVLTMGIPVGVLIGEKTCQDSYLEIRELIYNYLDLSNEQIYLRAKGRITRLTWLSWCAGIEAHMKRPVFKQVYQETKGKAGFSYLEKLEETNFNVDPKKWY